MMIYFAAPLFCQSERAYNAELTTKLEKSGFSVFLPQRDGIKLSEEFLLENNDSERCQKIFTFDRSKILIADIFLMILDGRVPDEGVCVALGIAHEDKVINNQEKLLIGYLTDIRVLADEFQVNPMISGALDYLALKEDELIRKMKSQI